MSSENLPARTWPQTVHESLAELRRIAKDAKRRDDPRLRKATADEIALAETLRKPFHCSAHSIRTGLPCSKPRVIGMQVCRRHGGATRHVKVAAARRLRTMVDPMLVRLEELAMQDKHLPTAQKAVDSALDRAGIGEVVEAKVRGSRKEPHEKIRVNIGFFGQAGISHETENTIVTTIPGRVEDTGRPPRDG